ncbi:RidA family protein [Marinomonas agarivorans]|nr:RidA family protein [Marinomonas agarivorans]
MIQRMNSNQRMSQIVTHNGTVYLAGQVAQTDTNADIAGQTEQILAQIESLLASVGSDKSKLLSAMIWVSDMANFQAMNQVWDQWINGENPPARACVEARLARAELLVEIQVVAATA